MFNSFYHGECYSYILSSDSSSHHNHLCAFLHLLLPSVFFFLSLSPLKLQASSEAEETLKRIQSHRGVTGILIVNKDGVPIKSTLSAEDTVQYAALITQVRLSLFYRSYAVTKPLTNCFLFSHIFPIFLNLGILLFVLIIFCFCFSARVESKERHSNIGSTKRHYFSASPIKKT